MLTAKKEEIAIDKKDQLNRSKAKDEFITKRNKLRELRGLPNHAAGNGHGNVHSNFDFSGFTHGQGGMPRSRSHSAGGSFYGAAAGGQQYIIFSKFQV